MLTLSEHFHPKEIPMANIELKNSSAVDEVSSPGKILNITVIFSFTILTLVSVALLCVTLYELFGIIERKKAECREIRIAESADSVSHFSSTDALVGDDSLERASEQESLEEIDAQDKTSISS